MTCGDDDVSANDGENTEHEVSSEQLDGDLTGGRRRHEQEVNGMTSSSTNKGEIK